jgi:hypothetical protein
MRAKPEDVSATTSPSRRAPSETSITRSPSLRLLLGTAQFFGAESIQQAYKPLPRNLDRWPDPTQESGETLTQPFVTCCDLSLSEKKQPSQS